MIAKTKRFLHQKPFLLEIEEQKKPKVNEFFHDKPLTWQKLFLSVFVDGNKIIGNDDGLFFMGKDLLTPK